MAAGFYVTIFSNLSINTYPKYTIGAFTVQQAHEIDLGTDRWEVGLYEFLGAAGTFKPSVVDGDTQAFIYCTLINS